LRRLPHVAALSPGAGKTVFRPFLGASVLLRSHYTENDDERPMFFAKTSKCFW